MASNVYPHAVRFSALVKSIAPAGLSPDLIAPLQMGVLDPTTFKTVTNAAPLRSIRVAVGSPNLPKNGVNSAISFEDPFNRRVSMKSMEIKSVKDGGFYTLSPRIAKPFIGYYGYNGVNECGSLEFKCGETSEYEVRVQGSIVERLYGQFEIFERFSVNTPCCPNGDCEDICDDAIDCKTSVEKLVQTMNDGRGGHNKVSRFGKFSVVTSCTADPDVDPITTYPANIWNVTVKDLGDDAALLYAQGQYPNMGVRRISSKGVDSTYEMYKMGASAPAAFVQETYAEAVPGNVCPIVVTPPTPVTTAWTDVGNAYKIRRTLCITLKNDECDTNGDNSDLLARIIAYYAGDASVVPGSIIQTTNGDCNSTFSMEQYNDNFLVDGCDTLGINDAIYTEPNAFMGYKWDVCDCVEPVETISVCNCGIKVESIVPGCELGGCGYDPTEFNEYDVPVFQIYKIDPNREGCELEDPKWFVAQMPSISLLDGHRILQEILLYREYRKENYVSPSIAWSQKFLEAEGAHYGIDPCKKYYVLHLEGDYGETTSLSASFGDKLIDLQLFFESRTVLDAAITLLSTYTTKPVIDVPIKYQIV